MEFGSLNIAVWELYPTFVPATFWHILFLGPWHRKADMQPYLAFRDTFLEEPFTSRRSNRIPESDSKARNRRERLVWM
jgi:hypothetical protein